MQKAGYRADSRRGARSRDQSDGLQPLSPHASQQLAWAPVRAVPFLGALHFAASCLIEHFVRPFAFVRQHVTKPLLPQVDCAAQRLIACAELFERVFAFT